jgi:hypothetical protein
MKLLETCVVHGRGEPKFIKLYEGDLSAIPRDEEVDLLVISAFPNDYAPTRGSLIGALHRRGISVEHLATDKEIDLRGALACWLSKDLASRHPDAGFRRILCFEPLTRGGPPEVVGGLFRALMPFALGDSPIRNVATPVLAAGDQGWDPEIMLAALFDAAAHWLAHGLPIATIKIVVRTPSLAERLRRSFVQLRSKFTPPEPASRPTEPSKVPPYECFVSYSRDDSKEVDGLVQALQEAKPRVRIFQDKMELKPGDAWQSELDEALEHCRKVIAVYSPPYLQSKMCMEEFNMARLRHRESGGGVLLPIYLRTANLPLYMRSIQYLDCREGDMARIKSACQQLVAQAFA